MGYREMTMRMNRMTSNQLVVATLLKACCDDGDTKAIELTFHRVLGKPEKAVVIKRVQVRTIYPNASRKTLKKPQKALTEMTNKPYLQNKVVVDSDNAPGRLIQRKLDKVGESDGSYIYEVLNNKSLYTVSEVMVANLYAIAVSGKNLSAIKLLLDYLDGAVADVVVVESDDVVLLENYAKEAPYEATKGEDGVFYTEMVAV